MEPEIFRFEYPWLAYDHARQTYLKWQDRSTLLLVSTKRLAVEVQNDFLRGVVTQGFLGEAVLPWGDYLQTLFRKAYPEKRLLPNDVSVRLLELAGGDCELEVLGTLLSEPGGLESADAAVQALSACDKSELPPLTGSARNRDMALLHEAWQKRAGQFNYVSRKAVPRLAWQALKSGVVTESRPLIVLFPSGHDPYRMRILDELSRQTDVIVYELAEPANAGDSHGTTLLERYQRSLPEPDPAAFQGALPDGSLLAAACPGERDEARRAIERIKREMTAGRWRSGDAAIVARRPERYLEALRDCAEDCGVPLDYAESIPVLSVPLASLLLAPLRFAFEGFERAALVDFFSSPILAPALRAIAPSWNPGRFAQLLELNGIGSSGQSMPADWNRRLDAVLEGLEHRHQSMSRASELDEEERERKRNAARGELDMVREHRAVLDHLFKLMTLIPQSGTASRFRESAQSVLEALDLKRALAAQYNISPHRSAPELMQRDFMTHHRFFRALEAFELRSAAIGEGDREYKAAEAHARIVAILEEKPLNTGQRLEDAVAVLRPEDVPPAGYRALFVLGMSHGDYPRPASGPLLLSDEVRASLSGSQAGNRIDEMRLFQYLVKSARETLILSRPHTGEDGARVLGSVYLDDLAYALERSLPGNNTGGVFTHHPVRSRIRPAEECHGARSLIDAVCAGFRGDPDPVLRGVYNNWVRDEARRAAIQPISRLAFIEAERDSRRLPGIHDGGLRPMTPLLEALRGHVTCAPLSASRVNRYAHCPAQYFYRYVLGIEPVEEPEFGLDALEKGNLVHELMRDFLSRCSDLEFPLNDTNRPLAVSRLESAAERLFQTSQWPDKPPRLLELEFDSIRRFFPCIIAREMEREGYRPAEFEFPFDSLEVEIEGFDRPIRFRGRIDRIDLSNGEPRTFVLIDYKSGSSAPTVKSIKDGLEFQIPIYVRAAARDLDASCHQAFYYRLLSEDDVEKSYIYKKDDPESLWNETVLPQLSALLTRLASGDFTPGPLPKSECDYCDYGDICRYREARFERKKPADAGAEAAP